MCSAGGVFLLLAVCCLHTAAAQQWQDAGTAARYALGSMMRPSLPGREYWLAQGFRGVEHPRNYEALARKLVTPGGLITPALAVLQYVISSHASGINRSTGLLSSRLPPLQLINRTGQLWLHSWLAAGLYCPACQEQCCQHYPACCEALDGRVQGCAFQHVFHFRRLQAPQSRWLHLAAPSRKA